MSEEKLYELLQQKRGLFETLLELSHEQKNEPYARWMALLQEKQRLLADIEAIDEKLSAFQENFSTLDQQIHDELEATHEVICEMIQLDEQHHSMRKTLLNSYCPTGKKRANTPTDPEI